mmetsp:Transcript_52032/g.166668  ORF Transcript_52032/g.166668 Transcript_52032/m.166668 type:complete len:203 (+) Transcript_52032:837-1445(+)
MSATPFPFLIRPVMLPMGEADQAIEGDRGQCKRGRRRGRRRRCLRNATRIRKGTLGTNRALAQDHDPGLLAGLRLPKIPVIGAPLDTEATTPRLAAIPAHGAASSRLRWPCRCLCNLLWQGCPAPCFGKRAFGANFTLLQHPAKSRFASTSVPLETVRGGVPNARPATVGLATIATHGVAARLRGWWAAPGHALATPSLLSS